MIHALARGAVFAIDNVRARLALRHVTRAGGALTIAGEPWIENEGTITLGRGVALVSRPTAVHLVARAGAEIAIGDGAVIEAGATIVAGARGARVIIGADARIGPMCLVLDDDGPDAQSAGVAIGDGATLEEGVTLLRGAVVRAGERVARGTTLGGAASALSTKRTLRNGRAATDDEARIDRVRRAATRIVPRVAHASLDAELQSIAGWDSLAALRVLVAVEDELHVVLPTDVFARPCTLRALARIAGAASTR
jgi:acetyltransferase-like isoleucine patch superfamily enzyme/acyl carrier protein